MTEPDRTKRPRSNSDFYHDLALCPPPSTRQRLFSPAAATNSTPSSESASQFATSSSAPGPAAARPAPLPHATNAAARPPSRPNFSFAAAAVGAPSHPSFPAVPAVAGLSDSDRRFFVFVGAVVPFSVPTTLSAAPFAPGPPPSLSTLPVGSGPVSAVAGGVVSGFAPEVDEAVLDSLDESSARALGPATYQIWRLHSQLRAANRQLQTVNGQLRTANGRVEQLEREYGQQAEELSEVQIKNRELDAENDLLGRENEDRAGRFEFYQLRMRGVTEAEARQETGYYVFADADEERDENDEHWGGEFYVRGR